MVRPVFLSQADRDALDAEEAAAAAQHLSALRSSATTQMKTAAAERRRAEQKQREAERAKRSKSSRSGAAAAPLNAVFAAGDAAVGAEADNGKAAAAEAKRRFLGVGGAEPEAAMKKKKEGPSHKVKGGKRKQFDFSFDASEDTGAAKSLVARVAVRDDVFGRPRRKRAKKGGEYFVSIGWALREMMATQC